MPPNMARHCPIVKWDGRPVASPSAEDVVHVMRRRRRRPRASVTRGRPTLSERQAVILAFTDRPASPSPRAVLLVEHITRGNAGLSELGCTPTSRWSAEGRDGTSHRIRRVILTARSPPRRPLGPPLAARRSRISNSTTPITSQWSTPITRAWAAVARPIAEVVRPGRTGGSDCLTGVASGGAPDWRRRTRDSASLASAAEVVCSTTADRNGSARWFAWSLRNRDH